MADTPSSYDDERDLDDAEEVEGQPLRHDPEADEADQLEQARAVRERVIRHPVELSPEVPEADALEQAMDVPDDDDDLGRDG